jgi:hypothetical protein
VAIDSYGDIVVELASRARCHLGRQEERVRGERTKPMLLPWGFNSEFNSPTPFGFFFKKESYLPSSSLYSFMVGD